MSNEPTSPVASSETPPDEGRQAQATSKPAPPPDVVTRQDFVNAQRAWESRNRQLLAEQQALHQQLEALQTKDMEPEERQSYQMQRYIKNLEARAAAAEQSAQQFQAEVKVGQALSRIAVKTGVPLSDLRPVWDNTQDADAVWEAAWELKDKHAEAERKKEEREEKRNANQVDVGSGRPITTRSQWDTALEAAQKGGDSVAYIRLLREGPPNK